LELSQAPVTLYTLHDHWLICPAHVLWKFRRRPCDGPQCIRCSLINGIPPQLWRYTRWPNRCLENADALLAQSHFSAQMHRQAGISQPIRVLPAFSRPLPSSDAEDYRSARPLFAYAGRVEPSKGIEDLVRAFRKRPQYDLVVAGAGSLLEKLRAEYADCPHIRFLGGVLHGEIASLFSASMAVISPTWGPEAFLLVNAEAMSCGTPVIGRRAGGSVETIERTGGGLIYEQPEELLPLVDRLAGNTTLRAELAERAAKGYREHFSEARWMEQYFETIEEIRDAKGLGNR
jgi:glycosyltransferase involved in cell wall biosynthesis